MNAERQTRKELKRRRDLSGPNAQTRYFETRRFTQPEAPPLPPRTGTPEERAEFLRLARACEEGWERDNAQRRVR
jgi:hypothetical protein